MDEYFKSWRRKIGIGMLLFACFVLVGWLRSTVVQDALTIHVGKSLALKLVSVSKALIFVTLSIDSKEATSSPVWASQKSDTHSWVMNFTGNQSSRMTVKNAISPNCFSTYEFAFGVNNTLVSAKSYQLSYWCFLARLTLISFGLLVGRRRQRKVIEFNERPHEPMN